MEPSALEYESEEEEEEEKKDGRGFHTIHSPPVNQSGQVIIIFEHLS